MALSTASDYKTAFFKILSVLPRDIDPEAWVRGGGVSEADAAQIKLTGDAEASKIAAIGKSTAEAYEQQVKAMGGDNFAKFKITEMIGTNGIKIIPEILISGNDGGNGPISGLLGMELLKQIQGKESKKDQTDINDKSNKA